jgi:hypothetical protein
MISSAIKAKRQLSRLTITTTRCRFSWNDQFFNHRLRLKLGRSSCNKFAKWCSKCCSRKERCSRYFILWSIASSLWKQESASSSSRISSSSALFSSRNLSLSMFLSHCLWSSASSSRQKIVEESRILKHLTWLQITFTFSWIESEISQH